MVEAREVLEGAHLAVAVSLALVAAACTIHVHVTGEGLVVAIRAASGETAILIGARRRVVGVHHVIDAAAAAHAQPVEAHIAHLLLHIFEVVNSGARETGRVKWRRLRVRRGRRQR